MVMLFYLLASVPFKPQPASEIKIFVLDGGRARLHESGLLSDEEDAPKADIDLADPCFLIEHGTQWLLWDTGLPDALVNAPQSSPMIDLKKSATMSDQLARLGLSPAKIDYVAFSHLHFDHTGTANLFDHSTWILQRRELNSALADPAPFSVVPDSFNAYRKVKKTMIDGDYDVFGDGTVEMLFTPGHTPGHMCLLVRLAHSGPIVLSGDLYHQRASRANRWVPTINASRSETQASISRIEAILRNLKARLVIQHDPKDYEALPKAPAFLD